MKYKYILNDKVLFETDNIIDYINYIRERNALNSVLYNLLQNAGEYTANMATAREGKIV